MRNNSSFLNVYKKKSVKSEVVTQLIYGDTFKKIKKTEDWIKIKNKSDNYTGYIKNKNFPPFQKSSHKVCVLLSNLYSKPSNRSKIKKKLSFGSKILVTNKKNGFFKFEKFWIKKKDLKKINFKSSNIFKDSMKFIGVKYKWGGKHYSGIDCSALVQLCLNFNNKFCPRDTKDQIKYFKRKTNFKKIQKDDLIFWKGHVAIVISKNKLIHAYGPLKKTLIMPINSTIKRIYKTANLKVIGVRRIK